MSMDGLMDHLCQRSTQPKDFIQTYQVMLCSIQFTKMPLLTEKKCYQF